MSRQFFNMVKEKLFLNSQLLLSFGAFAQNNVSNFDND
jgi:hypothetical protein